MVQREELGMERTFNQKAFLPTTETSLPSTTTVIVDTDDLDLVVGWDEESE